MPSTPTHATVAAALILALAAPCAAQGPVAAETAAAEAAARDASQDAKPSLFKRLMNPDRRFIIVPIPQSGPTVGTGIILAAGYFHPQNEEDEDAGLPTTSTQGAVGYMDSKSWGTFIQHTGFYARDTWRVDAGGGYVDLNLNFFGIGADAGGHGASISWSLKGTMAWPKVLRRIRTSPWFLGGDLRYIDTTSSFNANVDLGDRQLQNISSGDLDSTSVGLGALLERDTRDDRVSPYFGSYLQLDALFNDRDLGSDNTYQIYGARFRHYQPLRDKVTLATELKGRSASGEVPFFDLSRLSLRGASATRYMDRKALQFQTELRWRVLRRVGFVLFTGGGAVAPDFDQFKASTFVWSYGAGVRFLVAEKRRLNLRVDWGRTDDGDDSVHLFVGEAF